MLGFFARRHHDCTFFLSTWSPGLMCALLFSQASVEAFVVLLHPVNPHASLLPSSCVPLRFASVVIYCLCNGQDTDYSLVLILGIRFNAGWGADQALTDRCLSIDGAHHSSLWMAFIPFSVSGNVSCDE